MEYFFARDTCDKIERKRYPCDERDTQQSGK